MAGWVESRNLLATRKPAAQRPPAWVCSLLLVAIMCFQIGRPSQPFVAPARGWEARTPRSAASPRTRAGRTMLHEQLGSRTKDIVELSTSSGVRMQLLEALRGKTKDNYLRTLIMQLERLAPPDRKAVKRGIYGDWRVVGSTVPILPKPPAHLTFYTGSRFIFEGTTFNGELFAALLRSAAPDAELQPCRVRISEGAMVVSADVSLPSGRDFEVSYTTTIKAAVGGAFVQAIRSMDLPAPLGVREPLFQTQQRITVTYLDDQIMILCDQLGYYEILTRVSGDHKAAHRE